MAHPATTDELIEVIRPFVGRRLRGDLTAAIDILHATGNALRCDVRDVTDEGIVQFFYRGTELIPWADVYEVTVSGLDELGNRFNSIVFNHVGAQHERRAA